MKKFILFLSVVVLLSLGACSKKSCPAYSSVEKPTSTLS